MDQNFDIPKGKDPWEFILSQKQSNAVVSMEVRLLFADILERAGDSEILHRFEEAGITVSEKPP